MKIKKDLVYLASPYTHNFKKVMHYRFEKVMKLTAGLLKKGHFIFSPITYAHIMATKHTLPTNWEYWLDFDELIISRCDKLFVFTLDGWEESKGVSKEIEIAKKYNIPIFYINEKSEMTKKP